MAEAEELCDRVGIIQSGALLAHDTVANLKTAHGYEYKITFDSEEDVETLYGSDDKTLVAEVQSRGIRQYSVSKTTLEDVYLALTREQERFAWKATPDA